MICYSTSWRYPFPCLFYVVVAWYTVLILSPQSPRVKEKNKTLDSPAMSCMEQTLGNHLMPLSYVTPKSLGQEGSRLCTQPLCWRSSTTLISKHQVHWLRQDPENHRTMWASRSHWHELKLTGDTHAKTVSTGRQAVLP